MAYGEMRVLSFEFSLALECGTCCVGKTRFETRDSMEEKEVSQTEFGNQWGKPLDPRLSGNDMKKKGCQELEAGEIKVLRKTVM